ncbi:MAG: DUF5723 family protein [Bacteroidota bacterium]
MRFSIISLLVVTLAFSGSVNGQDLSTPLLDGSWQSTFSNPALLHRMPGKLTIGLPGAYNDLFIENFTYNDLVVEAEGRTLLDANQAIDLLGPQNEIRNALDLETIGIAIRGKKLALGFHHRIRYDGQLNYPKTLAQVIWQGNAQFIGQTVDIAPDIQILGYHEFGFSAAYKIADILTVGGRINYFSGISDASTREGSTLGLNTAEDTYDLTLEQDYVLNSSGTLTYEGLDGVTTDFDFGNLNFNNFLGSNTGIGFDLGAQLDLGKIRVQASALNLGASIDWEEDVRNYTLAGTEAFTGLDVLQNLLDDTTSFDSILDSIETQFSPTETANGYNTTLGEQFLLAAEIDLTEKLTVGGLLHYQNRKLEGEPSFAISGRYRLTDFLQAGAVYSYRAGSATNLGINVTAKLGPIILLAATDNIVTAFRPKDSQRANIRVGLSLSLFEEQE